jgi:hypothetical protein
MTDQRDTSSPFSVAYVVFDWPTPDQQADDYEDLLRAVGVLP